MPWNNSRQGIIPLGGAFAGNVLIVLLAGATLFSPLFSLVAEEKQLSVYSPVAVYSLPVLERGGREYVGLLELLEPLGRVSSEAKGHSLRLRYNALDAEFTAGKTRAKIHGRDLGLAAPFLIDDSRGLVSLNSLSALLPRFLGAPVNFRESARRLFVGNVAIQVGFKLDSAVPPRLALNFSAPVNPTISTEPGRLRMVFRRDPLISPGSQSISFDNKVITQASYSEANGEAELDIAATAPLMANFSHDRKTITVSSVQRAQVAAAQTPPQNPPQAPPRTPSQTSSGALPQTVPAANTSANTGGAPANVQRPLVVVDPAHGGDERGAALTDTLAEKDVTLGFARLLRHELETRGFAVLLLRDSDIALTLDERAGQANAARPALYISLHAVSPGGGAGVGVYTALLPVEGASQGIFHAWNTAQAASLPLSGTVGAAIGTELQKAELRKKEFPARASAASLRPLNNLVMPAVAVELAPGANGIADLTSANYQQKAAAAIADAVLSVRNQLEAKP